MPKFQTNSSLKMRIVHINFDANPNGGATIAMLRLHAGLIASGVDSRIVCLYRPEAAGTLVHRLPIWCRQLGLAAKVFQKILLGRRVSTGLVPTGIAQTVNKLNPDIIILHWLQNDTMAVSEMLQFKAPVLWFHHDLWPIHGLQAHDGIEVPDNQRRLDEKVRANKRRVAKLMGERLIPVCASQWASDEIRKSGMYAVRPIVLPLLVDSCFSVGPRTASKKFRILNGARGGFTAGLKGGDRLLAALELLPQSVCDNIEVVVFGESRASERVTGVDIHYVGWMAGSELAQQYRDADVFAFPSRYETYGQTKLEALACGTPVIAFDQAACAEGIVHKITGWVAPADDINSFADGLMWLYHAWSDGQPVRVSNEHNKSVPAAAVICLWENALATCMEEEC